MVVTGVVLTSVTGCIECGILQASGFRGGTPVSHEDIEDRRFDYLREEYNLWKGGTCPVCDNEYYHRLDLPFPARMDAVEDPDENWYYWGDL